MEEIYQYQSAEKIIECEMLKRSFSKMRAFNDCAKHWQAHTFHLMHNSNSDLRYSMYIIVQNYK